MFIKGFFGNLFVKILFFVIGLSIFVIFCFGLSGLAFPLSPFNPNKSSHVKPRSVSRPKTRYPANFTVPNTSGEASLTSLSLSEIKSDMRRYSSPCYLKTSIADFSIHFLLFGGNGFFYIGFLDSDGFGFNPCGLGRGFLILPIAFPIFSCSCAGSSRNNNRPLH